MLERDVHVGDLNAAGNGHEKRSGTDRKSVV